MKNFKRLIAVFLAVVMTLSFTVAVSAAEVSDDSQQAQVITYEVTSEGVQVADDVNNQARSSISGYAQKTLTAGINNEWVEIPVTASGVGGMGITIKTFSSWSGYTSLLINSNMGDVYVSDYALYSNDNDGVEFHNLVHYCPRTIEVTLMGIPAGESVFVQVWVYG